MFSTREELLMDVFELLGKGDTEGLKAALAADPTIAMSRNGAGASVLAYAAYHRNAEAVREVRAALPMIDPFEAIIIGENETVEAALAGGWDPNERSPDGFTPLGLAAFFDRRTIFDLLLPRIRDVNEQALNPQKVAAIHAASAVRSVGMVEQLLRAGADPNLVQADGFTPFHTAAHHGDGALAGLLLLFGGNPRIRNAKGHDAVALARASGHEWLAERLEAQR
jgi:ankyrin repeat protein